MATTRIYCPRCEWAPGPHDEWQCTPGCGTVWNTFETHARCPGCSKQWQVTVCLACFVGSLHEDWYHDETTASDAWSDAVAEDEELVEVGTGVPDHDDGGWSPPWPPSSRYSARSTLPGSARAARSAGSALAATATTSIVAATAP